MIDAEVGPLSSHLLSLSYLLQLCCFLSVQSAQGLYIGADSACVSTAFPLIIIIIIIISNGDG